MNAVCRQDQNLTLVVPAAMSKKTIRATATLEEDTYWRFKEAAARRRMTEKAAWEEATRQWVERPDEPPSKGAPRKP